LTVVCTNSQQTSSAARTSIACRATAATAPATTAVPSTRAPSGTAPGGAWVSAPAAAARAPAAATCAPPCCCSSRRSRATATSCRRSFELTDEGRSYVADNREALGSPWDDAGGEVPNDFVDLRSLIGGIGMATLQVVQSGDEAQIAEAKQVLGDARKALYRILAEAE
jgi:hypothetical protein